VNDAAKWGVAWIRTFNAVLSNQEKQKQYLLQVIQQNRELFTNPNKSTIAPQSIQVVALGNILFSRAVCD